MVDLKAIAAKWHDVVDAGWRVLERAHDLGEQLRDHHLFPSRKVFSAAVVTAIGYGIRGILQTTGVDLGPILGPEIPAIAGLVTAYMFTDGPKVHLEDPEDRTDGPAAIEESRVREGAARAAAARTTASSHSAAPPRND